MSNQSEYTVVIEKHVRKDGLVPAWWYAIYRKGHSGRYPYTGSIVRRPCLTKWGAKDAARRTVRRLQRDPSTYGVLHHEEYDS